MVPYNERCISIHDWKNLEKIVEVDTQAIGGYC